MLSQPVLPLVTDDHRILGAIRIPPTAFTGNETSYTLEGGRVVTVRKVRYQRGDGVWVQYMAIPISVSEERVQGHQHYPGFVDVSNIYHIDGWVQLSGIVMEPHRTSSSLEQFLQKDYYGN